MSDEENILKGWGDPVFVGQVRMDVAGKLGVILALTHEGLMLQTKETLIEIIPMHRCKIFEETTFAVSEI